MKSRDRGGGFDEYLWPLAFLPWNCDWEALAERERARRRLEEIYRHVQMTHIEPCVRRLGASPTATLRAEVASGVIEGAPDAPLWERRLKQPVPRALREEWSALCKVLVGTPGPPQHR